jgi:hypothetical protein
MIRPPLALVLVAVLMIALGETSGAVMARLRPQLDAYARARVAANPQAHGLVGSAEYDTEVAAGVVFAVEAALSFFHTHAEGMGLVALFTGSVAATVLRRGRARSAVLALLGVGALFPLGYLVYGLAVLERGREAGIALAEGIVLTPLGGTAIAGLLGLVVTLALARRPAP